MTRIMRVESAERGEELFVDALGCIPMTGVRILSSAERAEMM